MSRQTSQGESAVGRFIVTAAIMWTLWSYPLSQLRDPLYIGVWWFGAWCAALGAWKSIPDIIGASGNLFKLFRAFGHDETRGTAGWMSLKEIKRAKLHRRKEGSRFVGVVGGIVLWLHTETHHLILGPAGSQKTTAAIMNILMGSRESALIVDIKGELWATTRAHRERAFGHRCVKMDPKDPDNSARINPLDKIAREVEANDSAALTRVRGMALQLWPDPQGGGGQNDIFFKGARTLMVTVILAVIVVLPPEHRNLAMVYRALSDLDVLHDLLEAASKPPALSGEIADMARAAHASAFGDGANTRTFESFRTNALIALESFGPGNYLAAVTSETTFEFEDLKDKKTSFYILIDYANSAVLGQFFRPATMDGSRCDGHIRQQQAGALLP